MTKVGTGYIEIKPDWSEFGAGFDEQAKARVAALGRQLADTASRQVSKVTTDVKARFNITGLDRVASEVKRATEKLKVDIQLDVNRSKLAPVLAGVRGLARDIAAERPKLHVDIDRQSLALTAAALTAAISTAARRGIRDLELGLRATAARARTLVEPIRSAFSSIGGGPLGAAFGGIAAGLSGLLKNLPVIGGLFSGLTSAFGTSAIGAAGATVAVLALAGALAAIAASAGEAVAGLAVLGLALGAALGPVVLVGIAVLARLAVIIKDVTKSQTEAPKAAVASAAASQQAAAANRALGQAYENLRQQTDAARLAQIDATEAVKDDRLARAEAREGIVGARLSTRQAIKDLEDFRKTAGAAGQALGGVFKKFTDVNVDTSGLKKALAAATRGAGNSLTGDQELELEQKIHAVREAKLGEKAATDQLHDSSVKLTRDRKTEADFARDGLKAYQPYRAALEQVTAARAADVSATHKQADAIKEQAGAFDGLTTSEKNFATGLIAFGKNVKKAFGPATDAIFRGASAGLKDLTLLLKDPGIQAALVGIGEAIGGTISTLTHALTGPGARKAFVEFANVGIVIAGVFGRKVFKDFALIIGRIATAALPSLVRALGGILKFFDGLEHGTRDSAKLRETIDKLTTATGLWFDFLGKAIVAIVKIGVVLAPVGDAIISAFTNPSDALRRFARSLGLSKTEISALGHALRIAAGVIRTVFVIAVRSMAATVKAIIGTVARVFTDLVLAITAIAHGDWKTAWHQIRKIPIDVVHGIEDFLKGAVDTLGAAGHALGHAFAGGMKGALNGVVGFFRGTLNLVIDVIDDAIKAINKVTPGPIKVLGKAITPGIPDIPEIPHLALGGVVPGQGGTDSQLIAATPGEFMINPLGRRTAGDAMLHDLNHGRRPGGGGGVTQKNTFNVESKDPDLTAVKTRRELERLALIGLTAAIGRR